MEQTGTAHSLLQQDLTMTKNVILLRYQRINSWLLILIVGPWGCGKWGEQPGGKGGIGRPITSKEVHLPPEFSAKFQPEQVPIPEMDPAPPPGDLREEIDAFQDLPSCVKRHKLLDPLIADAVESLGYDSFVTDACRSIEALYKKEVTPCAAMLTSRMREHCETQVAMLKGEPELCPVRDHVTGIPERAPQCLAAARRDVRPCAALVGMARATCEGLVAQDPARCGLEGRCLRLVRRWMPVLPVAEGRSPYRGHIEVIAKRGEEVVRLELPREAEQGAIVAIQERRARLSLGDLRSFFVVDEQQGVGFILEFPEWPPHETKWKLSDREAQGVLRMRAVGALELLHGAPVEVQIERAATGAGGAIELAINTIVGPVHAPWKVQWKINTWLRDIVDTRQRREEAPAAGSKEVTR